MEDIIAGITRSIMNDMDHNNETFNKERLRMYLNKYYTSNLRNVQFAKDPGPSMVRLVAIKQMIDALKHIPL